MGRLMSMVKHYVLQVRVLPSPHTQK